jgi:thioredoxin 1
MNNIARIVILAVLVGAVITVFVLKQNKSSNDEVQIDMNTNINANFNAEAPAVSEDNKVLSSEVQPEALPKLVDLGADKCIPCKMMAPILEELKSEYEGSLVVEFIDVWKNPDEAPKYGIKVIPTQIFFNASGKELFRHEGFISKEDILAKWQEFGVELAKAE